ncbi:putative 2,4-dichlorophenol 6-monooxygenase, partial [Aspergillus heteromorphus CBS 117.55]
MPSIQTYDVTIIGGGPVGLLLAYQLTRFGLGVCVVEKQNKASPEGRYGRAITLFPRTLELLDQLDLVGPILQQGFACRSSVTYKDGVQQLPGKVWTFMENIQGTVFDFALVLRQMFTEDILRERLGRRAVYHDSMECVGFEVDEGDGDYAVNASCVGVETGERVLIKSKYLVGADGGHSFVRRHADIPFDGDSSEDQWIRIDGIVETDMPIHRAYGAIETTTHGNVLWAPLDHGATRIGYAYTPEIAAKYPDGATEEVAVNEAIECLRPFNLKFKEVHWWTLYKISQRMARSFSSHHNRIFLCGDAAHTHSSGAAQGLNTGIHDAVNLAWKLALEIAGLAHPDVLDTYTTERQSAVQRLLNYDKDISLLMTHKWPAWYDGDPNADPNLLLGEIFEQAAPFNTGLGISYPSNILNRVQNSSSSVQPGTRAPDTHLTAPGTFESVRLHRVLRNQGRFHILLFTGTETRSVIPTFLSLREYLVTVCPELERHRAVDWLTICGAVGCSPYEVLGIQPFGDTYFDAKGEGHRAYGVDLQKGGVVVIRPDGLVGFVAGLEGAGVRDYF